MIIGIGTDLVEVNRIRLKFQSNADLKKHVFSAGEIKYCEEKKNPYESFAVRFAAKEAFLKAVGKGMNLTLHLNQIEVVEDSQGCPSLKIAPGLAAIIPDFKLFKIFLSMTHTTEYGQAVVVIDK
ncbi:MAG: holo-ACP synthase [Bacteroidota bacterium]|nr:holo-ACP synthase [Bacteroidota bacterium]